MFKKNYIKVNSSNIDSYKDECYRMLDTILYSKKEQQKTIGCYSNKYNETEEQLVIINDEIKKISSIINELNGKIARLEVDIYACSYNYEYLSKQRMNSFNEFKNDDISIDEHKKINYEIDTVLKNYKQEYDILCKEFELLKREMDYYKNTYYNYKQKKKELLIIKKGCYKTILHAKKNISICNYNIDNINKTLEEIDILYFSGEEKVLDKKLQPKLKKIRVKE